MSLKSPKIFNYFLLVLLFLATGFSTKAQIYSHNFGTTTISTHPYTVAPNILNPNLSNSSWSNSENTWTSTTGSTGQAIRLTSSTNSTITLTFSVAPNYKIDITSFNFWRVRSNFGATNWSMTINGINVGSGTTPTTGAPLGNTNVSNAVSGLRGTVTVVISLTGATGNGTFRLDDFTLNGNVILDCSAATISSFIPATGPQNTLVTINGSGFQSGFGTSAVLFNGIPSTFNIISDTKIEAYVPAGNATGNITVTTNGCPGISTTPFNKIISDVATNYSSDIYISEIHDVGTTGDGGIGGSGGIIEIYNGTASTVNLADYSVKRYGDVGDANPSTTPLNLVGSIPPGGIFLLGLGNTTCSVTYDQIFNTGFNENDEFELLKNGAVIDNVHLLFARSGYTIIRNPDAVAPKIVFDGNDWYGFELERCDNIGIHNVAVPTLPTVTHPVSKTVCESALVTFTAPLSNPAGFTFQWKVVNAFGVWSNVVNNAQYSGATTNTLTINNIPSSFNNNQYYCEMTSTGKKVVSNAAQLKVSTGIVPDFPTTLNYCHGETIPSLNATSPNGISGTWSPATINNTADGTYIFTPNAGQCANSLTLNVIINTKTIPDFNTSLNLCNGQSAPTLSTVSPNGITGTWSPATIDNTADGTYTFTPNASECAEIATLNVTVGSLVNPVFPYATTYCEGSTVPVLATTSTNGISGTWSPATIDNTADGTYTFTPNASECATNQILNISITRKTVPDFAPIPAICTGGTVPTLATTSPNGISGTWSPATISNTADGTYTFTPDASECAEIIILNSTVGSQVIPNFNYGTTYCEGSTVPTLANISPNGISGTWSPATIDNTNNGTYTFTPNASECATNQILNISITRKTVPNFPSVPNICEGETVPVLATTSPNGVTGTWFPATINNTADGTYTFTPNASECAINQILTVTIIPKITPNFSYNTIYCEGSTVPALANISPNGISGTWSPATISNTADGTYTFTPNASECATNQILNISITRKTVPDFAPIPAICTGGTVPTLATTSPNGISGTWSPATISNTVGGTYTFTPDASECAEIIVLNATVGSQVIPNFNYSTTYCEGSTVPVLANISPNGISGIWSPATISNTANGTYTFTPNASECATSQILNISITRKIVPNFPSVPNICEGETAPVLATTSPNGITGTWFPATIDNTTNGTYTFTPNASECAISQVLTVTIIPKITPNFNYRTNFCEGETVPVLATTSPNGISGTWSPTTINTARNGRYTFTPNRGQCGTSIILDVVITPRIIPDFDTSLTICGSDAAPILNTISPNGIRGTWSPATISNTSNGRYTFTPNSGQCASPIVLNVVINNGSLTPITGPNAVCESNTIQLSNTTPAGVWSSSNNSIATIDSNGLVTAIQAGSVIIRYSLTFGSCNALVSKNITVNSLPKPLLKDKFICIDSQTGSIISRAELNTGITNSNHSFIWTLNDLPLSTTRNVHFANEPGIYKVIVTNLVTGCSSEATSVVKISSPAIANAVVTEDFDRNQIITVNVTSGSGEYEFQLDNGLPQESNQFFGRFSGEYTITVRDKNGCQEVILEVFALSYPRYFTPNGDGYHDTWNIDALEDQPEAKIYIFDRYGKFLKQIAPSKSGWDGTYNGQILPSTDYWFQLFYKGRNGQPKEFKAHFSMKK